MPKLAEAYLDLTVKRAGFDRGMKDAEASADRSVKGIQKKMDAVPVHWERVGRRMSDIGRRMTYAITLPLVGLGVAALKTAMDFDSLERGMTAVMGSAQAAREEMKKLREVAKLPGLGLKEAYEGSINLQAAGYSAEEARAQLLAFGNALATVGKGKAEMDRVTLALTQLANRTSGFGQEIRQLQEQLPQIRQIMMQAFNTADSEAIAKLGISGKQFVQIITTEFAKLPKMTGGIKNDFENMLDDMKEAMLDLGNKLVPIAQKIAEQLKKLLGWWEKQSPAMQENIVKWGIIIALAGPVVSALGNITAALMAMGKALVWVGGLVQALNGINIVLGAGSAAAGIAAAAAGGSGIAYGAGRLPALYSQHGMGVLGTGAAAGGVGISLGLGTILGAGALGVGAGYGLARLSDRMAGRNRMGLNKGGGLAAMEKELDERGQPTFGGIAKEWGMEDQWKKGGLSTANKAAIKAELDKRRAAWQASKATPAPPPLDTGLNKAEAADLERADELKLQRRRERAQAMGDEIKALQIDYLLEKRGVKGPKEGQALFELYEEKIGIKRTEMLAERAEKQKEAEEKARREAEKTAAAFRDNLREEQDAVRQYHANRLAASGKTYESERAMAAASFRSKIDSLQEEARDGKMVYARQLNAYAEYQREMTDIEKREADERKQLQDEWRREQKEIFEEGKRLQEDRLNLFETITTKIIRITQGEGAARIRENDLEARHQSTQARKLITDKGQLSLTLAAIEANRLGANRVVMDDEGRKAWQDRESWLERQRSKVRWTTAEGMFRSAAEAGARSGLSQPEYVPIKADPAELDLLTRIRGALERTEILTAQQMNALDRLAGAF